MKHFKLVYMVIILVIVVLTSINIYVVKKYDMKYLESVLKEKILLEYKLDRLSKEPDKETVMD